MSTRTALAPAPAAAAAGEQVERVLAGLADLASHQPVVAAVLRTLDAPASSAADLARAVGADPGLSGRLLRLANSAYFGLSGRVASLQFAVTAVGFGTVRGLAVSGAAGLSGTPVGHWERACVQAVGAGVVAGALGADPPDAFCAGLLADLGRGLLHRADPVAYARLTAEARGDAVQLLLAERDWCGTTHPQVTARLLAAWQLPPGVVEAVASHHRPPSDRSEALTVAVRVAEEVAQRVVTGQPAGSLRVLSRGRIADDSPVVARAARESGALLAAFAGA